MRLKGDPRLIGGLAVLAIIAAAVVILFTLRSSEPPPPVLVPQTDEQLLTQAERNPAGFLAQFGARPWREQPEPLRNLFATMRFEVAIDLQGLATDAVSAPTTAEATAAYQALDLPAALPLVTAFATVTKPAAASDPALIACKAQLRALRPKLVAARRAYLTAHLAEIRDALAP